MIKIEKRLTSLRTLNINRCLASCMGKRTVLPSIASRVLAVSIRECFRFTVSIAIIYARACGGGVVSHRLGVTKLKPKQICCATEKARRHLLVAALQGQGGARST